MRAWRLITTFAAAALLLAVSTGSAAARQANPPFCVVPQLVGMTLPQAKAALIKAKCAVGHVRYIKWNPKWYPDQKWPYKNMHRRVLGTLPVAGVVPENGNFVDLTLEK